MRVSRTGLLALAYSGLFVLHALWFGKLFSFIAVDDAYISFRYASNLVHGAGAVFNSGERVEGYSNFLWMMLLGLPARLGDPTLFSEIFGLILSIAALLVALWALRRVFDVDSLAATMVLGAVVVSSPYFAAWSVSGMESGLYGLLLVGFWARLCLEFRAESTARFPAAALLCVAIALSRPEGLFVALDAIAFVLFRGRSLRNRRKHAWTFVAIVAGGLLVYHAWRFAYYGSHLFPNSVHAKVGGTVSQIVRGSGYVLRNFLVPHLPLLAVFRIPASRRGVPFWSALALVALHLGVVAGAGGDWSTGRYFAPLIPLVGILVAVAADAVIASSAWRASAAWRIAGCSLWVLWLAGIWYWAGWKHEAAVRREFVSTDRERIELGQWLAAKTPPETRIAVYAAGQLAYYSGRYTHDMLGINDAHIAHVAMPTMGKGFPGHERSDPNYTLLTVRPDVVIDAQRIPGMSRHPAYGRGYVRIPTWKICQVAMRRELVDEIIRQHGPEFLLGEEPH